MRAKPVRILVIEDNPNYARLIKAALVKADTSFAVRFVERLSDAEHQLRCFQFQAVLADLTLSDSHGLETVVRIREAAPNVPIVVLTGLPDDDVALASLAQGEHEYLIKDRITPEILDMAIRYGIQRQRNAEMRRLLNKVRASEKLLKRKNRRLARLYRTAHHSMDDVSHEFRTPLTVITEYVSLLRDGVVGSTDQEQCRMLDIVGDRANDLNNMVDDMLDVNKLKSGLLGVNRENCHISTIVDHVRVSLERKAATRRAQFEVAFEDQLPEVYCNPEKIGRVIINLAVNAIKFCGDPGKVRLWARHDPESSQVVVGITDDGPGIDQAQLTTVFERFKQLESRGRDSTKGFGLGLNIAKELVELNLGRLLVESQPGKGSTFSFTVPVAQPIEVMARYLKWLGRTRNRPPEISLLEAYIDKSTNSLLSNDAHSFLNFAIRRNDLLLRADVNRWLLVLPVDRDERVLFVTRLMRMHQETNRNRPQGPLPTIHVRSEGTWPITDDTTELVAQVARLVTPLFEAYA